MKKVTIKWPNNKNSNASPNSDWLKAAFDANIQIPTGCMGGSCGACEIEVNGEVIRACIDKIPNEEELEVEFLDDPYW